MTLAFTSSSRAILGRPTYHPLHTAPRPLSRRHAILQAVLSKPSTRSYATPNNLPPGSQNLSNPNESSSELETYGDGLNAPLSTLPPPLLLPQKTPDLSTPIYYWRIGRAYGKFYIAGVKATWSNYKKAKPLRQAIRASNNEQEDKYPPRRLLGMLPPPLMLEVEVYMRREGLLRSQFQLLMREREDVKKLPLFAVLVAVFGEWLPLLVPLIPGRVPKTCRIPKQVVGMRKAVEERRKQSFRLGLTEPAPEVLAAIKERVIKTRKVEEKLERESRLVRSRDAETELDEAEGRDVLALRVQPANWLAVELTEALDRTQLTHVSTTLGLHGKFPERIGAVGDSPLTRLLLTMKVVKRLHYLNLDDELLVKTKTLKDKTQNLHALSTQELEIACLDRGIDVVGRGREDLLKLLEKWLHGRTKDKGYGSEILKMLFRRPNAW
ncbi:hypothetical protein BDV97DRAFT_348603 [Delphinella strobiligena]|nr:hypothetical protein BDV97DRAFT_348603 [Delphinella strobiligena]